MQVFAPKDGYIATISPNEGDTVQAGSVVARMDPTESDLTLARLASIDALRAIYAKRLAPPAVDLTRRLSQIAVETARIQEMNAQSAFATTHSLDAMGQFNDWDQMVPDARKLQSEVAPLQRETQEKNLALFEYLIAEISSVNALIKAHIEKEVMAATAIRSGLSLKALNTGVVHLKVRAGSFVTEGAMVFEVV